MQERPKNNPNANASKQMTNDVPTSSLSTHLRSPDTIFEWNKEKCLLCFALPGKNKYSLEPAISLPIASIHDLIEAELL